MIYLHTKFCMPACPWISCSRQVFVSHFIPHFPQHFTFLKYLFPYIVLGPYIKCLFHLTNFVSNFLKSTHADRQQSVPHAFILCSSDKEHSKGVFIVCLPIIRKPMGWFWSQFVLKVLICLLRRFTLFVRERQQLTFTNWKPRSNVRANRSEKLC
jgi:hypothetical protein